MCENCLFIQLGRRDIYFVLYCMIKTVKRLLLHVDNASRILNKKLHIQNAYPRKNKRLMKRVKRVFVFNGINRLKTNRF
jgi:hypothetical protein